MKAIIKVSGPTRNAQYSIDTDNRVFHRDSYEQHTRSNRVGETCRTEFYVPDYDSPQFTGAWVVLIGTPEDLVANMLDDCPMSLIHSQDIFDELEKWKSDDVLCLTFEGFKEFNYVIRNSSWYKLYRTCQRNIVSNMYGIPKEKVIVLPDI